MQATCPTCHCNFPLEAAVQDAAGRELIGLFASIAPQLVLPLMHYLAFFRPAKQQLGWGRALRLAREVIACDAPPHAALEIALVEANRSLSDKRAQPGWKPLGNHNYLRRCLESATARAGAVPGNPPQQQPVSCTPPPAAPRVPQSRTAAAMLSLEELRR